MMLYLVPVDDSCIDGRTHAVGWSPGKERTQVHRRF